MSHSHSPRRGAAALALSCLVLPLSLALPVRAEAAGAAEAKAVAKLEKVGKSELAAQVAVSDLIVKEFSLSTELVLVQLQKESITPAEAVTAATDALALALAELKQAADTALLQAELVATEQLALLDGTPKGFRVGGLGAWDSFEAKVRARLAKAATRVDRRLVQFGKKLEALAKNRPLVLHAPARPLPDAFVPGVPAMALQRPVVLFAVSGSSTKGADGDGKLCVAGTADPAANGGVVTVRVLDAAGVEQAAMVPVQQDGRFSACFPQDPQQGLAEGNYRVIADQGGAPAGAAVAVP